ncbi:VOC family protein, partial [Oceanicola sp. S124]|uniref:VOC family protein n=1 Tax=Oceanicola sp. S124 TaxID=1042378 RepID=UPI00049424A3
MKPAITVLTLAVADLQRALLFYRDGLGLKTEGIIGQEFEHGAVVFFDLVGGAKLALWAQADLAHDAGLPEGPVTSTAVSIGQNVARRDEVDAVLAQAAAAGARIV